MQRVLIFLVLILSALTGCRSSSEAPGLAAGPPQDPDERDAVLTALQNMKQDAMRGAFAALPRYQYTRYTRIEQSGATRQRDAFEEHVVRIEQQHTTPATLYADSAGTFDTGFIGRFADAPSDTTDLSTLPQYVLVDDPPYLTPRNREAYRYTMRPDTTIEGAATQVIEVKAVPGADQAIRLTRFYLDRATGEMIAIYEERVEDTMFFSEESRYFMQIRRAPDEGWVPFLTQFTTRLDLPLHAPQRFRTTSAYYLYASLPLQSSL